MLNTINLFYLQIIGVEISPSIACLSVDSSFQLARGEGVFQGSICEVIDSVTLRFYANDSHTNIVHYTDPTPPISVSGDIYHTTLRQCMKVLK